MIEFNRIEQELRKHVHTWFSNQQHWTLLLAGLLIVLLMAYARYALLVAADHDEVEHAHVAFRILNGEVPYRDFYQNHWPAYWLLSILFVDALPFSTNSILAGRIVGLLFFSGCWLLGALMLTRLLEKHKRFAVAVYSWALLTLAYQMDFHVARGDPLMTLLATAALFLVPALGTIRPHRAAVIGILLGLATSVSTKTLPMALVVPALVAIHCIRDRSFEPVTALVPYTAGILLGLAPTAIWIFYMGLGESFYFDVFDLNRALSKPWHKSFEILKVPIFVPAVLGAMVLLWTHLKRADKNANTHYVVVLAIVSGFLLAILMRHPAIYNLQLIAAPLAICFAYFTVQMCAHTRGVVYRVLLCGALIGYPTTHAAIPLLKLQSRSSKIPLPELQKIIDLAEPGTQTCTAFSPSHPIFCHDVSGLSNKWDLLFATKIEDSGQLARFRRIWHTGIQNTVRIKPDIILRRSPFTIWERAVKADLVTPEQLTALDALESEYNVMFIGPREFWVRPTASSRATLRSKQEHAAQ